MTFRVEIFIRLHFRCSVRNCEGKVLRPDQNDFPLISIQAEGISPSGKKVSHRNPWVSKVPLGAGTWENEKRRFAVGLQLLTVEILHFHCLFFPGRGTMKNGNWRLSLGADLSGGHDRQLQFVACFGPHVIGLRGYGCCADGQAVKTRDEFSLLPSTNS